MPLIWFTAGFALASLAGVLLDGAVWLAAVGLALRIAPMSTE